MRRDAIEHLDGSDDDDAILVTASEWVVRSSSDALTPHERAAFEAWLAVDPRHGAAYDAASRTWEDVGALEDLAALADPDPAPPPWMSWARAFRQRFAQPAAVAAGLVAAGAAAIAFLTLPELLGRRDAAPDAQAARERPVQLPDDSVVKLGAESEIEVRFTAGERRVSLTNGAALFEVTRDERRPFFVEAGDAVVRVVGTRFEVRRDDELVGVSVLEGVVQVSFGIDACATRVLRAGERAELPPPEVSSADAASGVCTHGRLSYDDVRLGELVDDLNRFYAPGVALSSSAQHMRVTASFRIEEIPTFLDTLGAVLPVTVEQRADRSFTIAASPSGEAVCSASVAGC